ncbi:hypothetical protein ACFFKH_15665 [Micromonospora marina]|nr:hypothetical protein [Micromonospora marina]
MRARGFAALIVGAVVVTGAAPSPTAATGSTITSGPKTFTFEVLP